MLPLIYFLKVIICSSILIAYYFLVLRNKIYHQYNRFYLLFVVLISWAIPLLDFKINIEEPQVAPAVVNVINYFNTNNYVDVPTISVAPKPIAASVFTFANVSIYIYLLLSLLILLSVLKTFFMIFKLKKQYRFTTYNDYKVYFTQDPSTPFSFFNLIFWNDNIELETILGKQILQHEIVHIQEKHSLDKLLIQINLIVGWFNPIFWILKNELDMIHEFIADKKSVPNASTEVFAQMILNTAFIGSKTPLTNPFFFSPIKRRLLMLTKKQHTKFSYAQRVAALPVTIILIGLFSIQATKAIAKNFKKIENRLEKAIQQEVFSENKDSIIANLKLENEAPSEVIMIGGASEAELNEYYFLIAKAFKVANEAYDFSLLTDTEKNRIIDIVEKMDAKQKLKVPVHFRIFDNKPPFKIEEVGKANWAKWKINENYTMRVDNKEMEKALVYKNYTPESFKYFSTQELIIFSNNPQDNRYEINLFSTEFYNAINARPIRKKLVTNDHQLISNNGKEEASDEEIQEMMTIFNKYSPFKTTTATTLNGITPQEEARTLVIFNKMSKNQRLNSPIVYQPKSSNLNIQPIEKLLEKSNVQTPTKENFENWLADSTHVYYLNGALVNRSSIATINPASILSFKAYTIQNRKMIFLFTSELIEKNNTEKFTKENSQIFIGNNKN